MRRAAGQLAGGGLHHRQPAVHGGAATARRVWGRIRRRAAQRLPGRSRDGRLRDVLVVTAARGGRCGADDPGRADHDELDHAALNRTSIEKAARRGLTVVWAVADHPWVDEAGAAAVRVAMTVIAKDPARATLDAGRRARPEIVEEIEVPRLNADLQRTPTWRRALRRACCTRTEGLSSRGFTLVGRGFVLTDEAQAEVLTQPILSMRIIIRPYLNGRDLSPAARGLRDRLRCVTKEEARAYPVLYDIRPIACEAATRRQQ